MNKLVKRYYDTCLAHHGVKGQRWGERNGPPYPLKPKETLINSAIPV